MDHGERPKWYGHAMIREEEHSEKSAEDGYTMKIEDRMTENKIGDHSTRENET